jgi:hypothetical protein
MHIPSQGMHIFSREILIWAGEMYIFPKKMHIFSREILVWVGEMHIFPQDMHIFFPERLISAPCRTAALRRTPTETPGSVSVEGRSTAVP